MPNARASNTSAAVPAIKVTRFSSVFRDQMAHNDHVSALNRLTFGVR